MDMSGWTVSDGATYYYNDDATGLVPQYKKSYNVNGKSAWYLANGERADSQWVGEVKANLILCDSGGTPDPAGVYLKQDITKYSVFTADQQKTANNWYSALGVPQVLAIADLANIQDNIEFINKDPWKQLLYKSAHAEPDYTKINKYVGLVEAVNDLDGPTYDLGTGTGITRTYALKDGVVKA